VIMYANDTALLAKSTINLIGSWSFKM
jgi:hypothetical protein